MSVLILVVIVAGVVILALRVGKEPDPLSIYYTTRPDRVLDEGEK